MVQWCMAPLKFPKRKKDYPFCLFEKARRTISFAIFLRKLNLHNMSCVAQLFGSIFRCSSVFPIFFRFSGFPVFLTFCFSILFGFFVMCRDSVPECGSFYDFSLHIRYRRYRRLVIFRFLALASLRLPANKFSKDSRQFYCQKET